MVTVVPEPDWLPRSGELISFLEETLDALLEFTGATAGWVGLADPDGRLHFPARRGTFPQAWLGLQQGQVPIWGFEVREGPTLLNDLPALPALGEPPLRNLLSCQLLRDRVPGHASGLNPEALGQIVLANKSQGFTSHDALVLQAVTHLLRKRLAPRSAKAPARVPAPLFQRILDRISEGVLVVDQTGRLLFANATWARWTGFPPEELANHPAPFPFWVSHRDLASSSGFLVPDAWALVPHAGQPVSAPMTRLGCLPFRHRNNTVFWCQVEIGREEMDGQPVTLAALRRLPPTAVNVPGGLTPRLVGENTGETAGHALSFQALAADLPFAVALTDRHGQVLWVNAVFAQQLPAGKALLGQPLRSVFTTASAALLEQLIRKPGLAEPGQRGCMLLSHLDREGLTQDLVAHWLTVVLPEGPGFLFALADDWAALWPADGRVAQRTRTASRPTASWLVLLHRPGRPIHFWDERWQRLTGLTPRDLAGVAGELVLDWLFPQQHDRDFVADLLHQPTPRGTQAVLEVVSCTGSRPLLCTFLPVAEGAALGEGREASGTPVPLAPAAVDTWLILVCEPESFPGEDATAQRFLRQFSRGLSHLLNNYLAVPVGLAEMALDRSDLPVELTSWFSQILENCMRANQLIASLQDLAAVTPGELQQVPLATLVREAVAEYTALGPPRAYELTMDVRAADALVAVNPRMLKVVLRHLLTNAEHALLDRPRQRIDIRVFATDGLVGCEIQDTGGGLPTADWTVALAPFYSTKGPFAREGRQASLEATGLGLTVSHHLLGLHGGRLELRSIPDEGTTACFFLPRGAGLPGGVLPARTAGETVRTQTPSAEP